MNEGNFAIESVHLRCKQTPATSIVALRIAEVVAHHHDLNTAWTKADPNSVLNVIEAAVRTMRAKGAPGMTLFTEQGADWVIDEPPRAVTTWMNRFPTRPPGDSGRPEPGPAQPNSDGASLSGSPRAVLRGCQIL